MDLKHHDHLDAETGGQRAGEIRAERWESVLIRVFGGLVVISLAVLFWPAAEKMYCSTFRARVLGDAEIRGPEVSRHRHGRRAARPASPDSQQAR